MSAPPPSRRVVVEDGKVLLAGLPAPQHAAGGEGPRVPRPHGGRAQVCGRPRPRVLHRLGRRASSRPLVGGKLIQEVVAVAACVERQHPDVRFVSEIGGEDMKTIFFTPGGGGKTKQVYMQSACSGGTGTFIEKTARKLAGGQRAAGRHALRGHEPAQGQLEVRHLRRDRREHARQDGRAGRGDHRQPVRGGGLPEPRHADQGQHALPEVLLLGGPNLFFRGLQEAWRHHLAKLWEQRKVALPEGTTLADCIVVPKEALYYACLGCVEIGARRARGRRPSTRARTSCAGGWRRASASRRRKDGGKALVSCAERPRRPSRRVRPQAARRVRAGRRGRARPRRPGAGGLRLRQHHREGGGALARARAALLLLRAVQGQSHRGRAGAVRQVRDAGFSDVGGARAHRLRQGPAQGRARRRRRRWWRRWRMPRRRCTSSPTPT